MIEPPNSSNIYNIYNMILMQIKLKAYIHRQLYIYMYSRLPGLQLHGVKCISTELVQHALQQLTKEN